MNYDQIVVAWYTGEAQAWGNQADMNANPEHASYQPFDPGQVI